MSPAAVVPSALFDVKGKVAVITGATGAFGRMAATVLAQAGALVALAAGSAGKLEAVRAEISANGGKAVAVGRRPETAADAEAIVQAAVDAFGGVDILVLGSGTNDVSLITEMSPERWQKVMDANVKGSWLMCQAAGKRMIAQGRGGKVVLMSSARGKLGHPAGYTAYCASKSAVEGITRALGCEWGKHRINVNAIGPTVFRSNLTAWMFSDEERGRAAREGILSRIPLGRLGEPEDLAGVLLFLTSSASDFCTGQVIAVDGGYTAG